VSLQHEEIARFPKVLLHDHLDGGLRPESMIEIAAKRDYRLLPTMDPDELKKWFFDSCSDGSLERYLETFDHTIALMQEREDIVRVAREAVIDLAQEHILYAEIRGAPELFTRKNLSLDEVIEATLVGYREGMEEVSAAGGKIKVHAILCAMRHESRSHEVAEAAIRWRDKGVAGFDIAGAEKGFPAKNHLSAFSLLTSHQMPFTIHAGEADGVESIKDAINFCGSKRIGHGVRIVDDIKVDDGVAEIGEFAQSVLTNRIHLELAPTSNIQTGVSSSYEAHPINLLHKLGFNLSINTDNRLMSNTSLTAEMTHICQAFEWSAGDLMKITLNSMNAAFINEEEKLTLSEAIERGYAGTRD